MTANPNEVEVEEGTNDYPDPEEFEAGDDGDFLEEPDLNAGVTW